jgi:pimeloyl-ACP methyl ester carboxylesterase
MRATPFKIDVADSVLDDLRVRLERTRWADDVENAGWQYGTSADYLRTLCQHWGHNYDWRKHEARLNAFANFKVDIDGVGIHFIHQKSQRAGAPALLLTHGWPDSFHRFHQVIPLLTDTFEVVVPSLPGFGFSDRQSMPSTAVADRWAKLMTDVLGYRRFFAAGGDLGTLVTKALALQHPELLAAIHLTDVGYPSGQEDQKTMTQAEREFLGVVQAWLFREGAYAMLHTSKPQSLSIALNDSPAGLASWIVSFTKTTADGSKVDEAFGGRDELLTNITIYWVTQTAGSAARMYLEEARASWSGGGPKPPQRSKVPAYISLYPREAQFPREWAERTLTVARFTRMPTGGHFAALEMPEVYAKDLKESFASSV